MLPNEEEIQILKNRWVESDEIIAWVKFRLNQVLNHTPIKILKLFLSLVSLPKFPSLRFSPNKEKRWRLVLFLLLWLIELCSSSFSLCFQERKALVNLINFVLWFGPPNGLDHTNPTIRTFALFQSGVEDLVTVNYVHFSYA